MKLRPPPAGARTMPRAAGIVALLLLHLPPVWLFSCTTHSVDCAALSDLYATCNSPSCLSNWRAAAQSGTPLNACTSLGGVACDATGRVNSLCVRPLHVAPARKECGTQRGTRLTPPPSAPRSSLTSVGLAGTIPASVGNLTGLTFLCAPRCLCVRQQKRGTFRPPHQGKASHTRLTLPSTSPRHPGACPLTRCRAASRRRCPTWWRSPSCESQELPALCTRRALTPPAAPPGACL